MSARLLSFVVQESEKLSLGRKECEPVDENNQWEQVDVKKNHKMYFEGFWQRIKATCKKKKKCVKF